MNGVTTTQYGLTTYGYSAPAAAPTVYNKAMQSSAFVVLNPGDYVSVWINCVAAITANAGITTSFSMVQVRSLPIGRSLH